MLKRCHMQKYKTLFNFCNFKCQQHQISTAGKSAVMVPHSQQQSSWWKPLKKNNVPAVFQILLFAFLILSLLEELNPTCTLQWNVAIHVHTWSLPEWPSTASCWCPCGRTKRQGSGPTGTGSAAKPNTTYSQTLSNSNKRLQPPPPVTHTVGLKQFTFFQTKPHTPNLPGFGFSPNLFKPKKTEYRIQNYL